MNVKCHGLSNIHLLKQFREQPFDTAIALLAEKSFTIIDSDKNRPWGGFLVIAEGESIRFAKEFFPSLNTDELVHFDHLSPKLLLVAPGKRLSWQYHNRRSERWRVIFGEAGVVRSETDEQGEVERLSEGDAVQLNQGERHRLVGFESWALIAEIWQHTVPGKPSDEEDIIRLEDDFGR